MIRNRVLIKIFAPYLGSLVNMVPDVSTFQGDFTVVHKWTKTLSIPWPLHRDDGSAFHVSSCLQVIWLAVLSYPVIHCTSHEACIVPTQFNKLPWGTDGTVHLSSEKKVIWLKLLTLKWNLFWLTFAAFLLLWLAWCLIHNTNVNILTYYSMPSLRVFYL